MEKKKFGTEQKESHSRKEELTALQKAWAVCQPLAVYYIVCNAVCILLIALCSRVAAQFPAFAAYLAKEEGTARGVIQGVGMLAGAALMIPSLLRELSQRTAKYQGCGGVMAGKSEAYRGRGCAAAEKSGAGIGLTGMVKTVFLTIVLGVSSSLGLNALLSFAGFAESSQTYRQVAESQYSVAFGAGIILYGLVSPLTEEIVFRGLIYNRLRRFFGPVIAVFTSAVFFGAFHGNLVQGIYGACMGLLIAWWYERKGGFFVPVLFHMAANLAVYITAHLS